jgi:hypothetical protein
MASKSKRARLVKQRSSSKDFMYWAIAVFIIKLIIIRNVQGRAWLGADGESYLKGADSLIQKGFFSEDTVLNYWPAGYPLFIFLFSIIGKSFVLTTLTVIQSAICSFATYFFAAQLVKTRLNKFAYLVFFIILFNPTLSLSSLAIGYESIAASGYLVAAAIIIKDLIEKDDKKLIQNVLITSGIFGLMSFIQPRLIVSGILINLLWILIRRPWKSASVFIATSLAVTLFFPATLIYRNNKAVGLNTISTNLGVTMNIGAGDKSTGGYTNSATGVDCNSSSSDVVKADREQVACILKWYLVNPKPTLRLFYNKSIFFWSPWYGPEANGTMARNPWLKINPIKNISESSPDGQKLIYGGLGKLISWIWLIGGIVLFTYGFLILWRLKSIERIIGLIAGIAVMSSWLITLISIGDHRFRLPIMGMSLLLQAVGIRTLFKGGKPPMVDGPALR